jgi:uncharacterized damage-inducible protein DinB
MTSEPDRSTCDFRQLESERIRLLTELSQWPPNEINVRPSPGAWSALEVLDHIVRVECETMVEVREGLRNPCALETEERLGIAALQRALRSDRRLQLPPGSDSIYPDQQTTLADAASRWVRSRSELGTLLNTIDPRIRGCGVFCHPSAGWMTIHDVLDYLSAHLHHHRFQLARLLGNRTSSND